MEVQLKTWGNGVFVNIPANVMTAAGLGLDQAVEVREEDGRIVIEPIRTPTYDLDRLLDQMTPETFPENVDAGAPVGREETQP